MNIEVRSVPSPCVGICKIDEASGWCRGCGRSEEEIAAWALAEDARRTAIWDLLPARIAALGIAITRLPWRRERIAEFAAASLREKTGTWVFGGDGAFTQFPCAGDEPCDISVTDNNITAVTPRGGLQLAIGENVRALQLHGGMPEGNAILLVVLKAKASLPVATGLTPLGPDTGALNPEYRGEPLFDLGLGRPDLQLCIRTGASKLAEMLNRLAGEDISEVLRAAGPAIRDHCPTRVFVSPLGRAEIFSHALVQGAALNEIALTPAEFARAGREAPCYELPPPYALGAAFYPGAKTAPLA